MRRTALLLLIGLGVLALPLAAQEGPEKDFKLALQLQNEKELEKACRALVSLGSVENAKLILGSFAKPDLEADVYWILVRAASAFQNSNALEVVGKYVVENKGKPVSRDLAMALHNNFSAGAEQAFCQILLGGNEELRVSALDYLMDAGKKDAIAATMEILKKDGDGSIAVKQRCGRLLNTLTGLEYGDSVSNWTGWWEANKGKSWEEIKKGGGSAGIGTTTLGNSRQNEFDKLKDSKVLILRAGDKCKCKKGHDLDEGIDRFMSGMPWTTESITKDKFEHDAKVTDEYLRGYIAIVAICTHIREHCACPTCKPGGKPNMRLYK